MTSTIPIGIHCHLRIQKVRDRGVEQKNLSEATGRESLCCFEAETPISSANATAWSRAYTNSRLKPQATMAAMVYIDYIAGSARCGEHLSLHQLFLRADTEP